MEKIKENIENNTEKIDFEGLRQQVESIQKVEMAKKEKGEHYDPHFDFIKPNELIEKDFIIFHKFLKETLTKGDFFNYNASGEMSGSRLEFKAWLGNKLQVEEWFIPELKDWNDSKKV
jgi:hypothetical protein